MQLFSARTQMKLSAPGLNLLNIRQSLIGKASTSSTQKKSSELEKNISIDGSSSDAPPTTVQADLATTDSTTSAYVKPRIIVPFTVAQSQGQVVVNPLDSLTNSDIKIIEAATGLTEKDGKMCDANGKETYSDKLRDVMMAIFQIRNFGVPDIHSDTVIKVQGDITKDQMSKYVEFYALHGGTAFDASTLKNIMECIDSEKLATSQNSTSKIKDIIKI